MKPYAFHAGHVRLLSAIGVDVPRVLRRAELPPDLASRGPTTIEARAYHRLWQAIDDDTADPLLALRIARSISADTFDVPVFAALCSANLAVAAARLATYKALIGPLQLRVDRADNELRIGVRWPEDLPAPPLFQVSEVLWWTAFARLATQHEVRPLYAIAPAPPSHPAYAAYLGAAFRAGPDTAVAFSVADAGRPFLTANEQMWGFFEPELRARLSMCTAETPFAARVRSALLELLPSGDPSMGGVARALGVSTRTLQRRLREEGTTFQARLDDTREALARHYLTTSRMPAAEIAFLLGYGDPNSFYRAFQSWTGSTPERVRAAADDGRG